MRPTPKAARPSLAGVLPFQLFAPILVVFAWALAFAQPAQAQTCIDDVTDRTNNCTANDVVISLVLNDTDVVCELGSTVDLSLTALLEANANERWDIGMFIALDGGDARTGECYQDYLPPPLAAGGTCSVTGETCFSALDCPTEGLCDDGLSSCNTDLDCPVPNAGGTCLISGGTCFDDADCYNGDPNGDSYPEDPCVGVCDGGQECTGGYDPVGGLGPFYDGEDDVDPADSCGDLEQGVGTYYKFPEILTAQCVDHDGDGRVDIGACVSWDNARSDGSNNKPSCLVASDTEPNTKAKCRCEDQNIGNVYLAGKIIVDKVTDPSGSSQSFDFTTNYGDDFSLTDAAEPNDSGPILPTAISGTTYSVSEISPEGWSLTDVTCTGEVHDPDGVLVSSVDKPDPTDIEVLSGETVTCVFTNTLARGQIIVDKVTDPSGSTQSFDFTTNYGDGFSLTDGATPNNSGDLLPSSEDGTYSVSEGAVAGWDLTSAVCDDGSDPSAIDLGPGETVTCTFTNTLQRGKIIVDKVTDPSGSSQSFDFTTSYGSPFSLTDAATPNDSGDLLPSSEGGLYSVSESAVAGWELTSASCDDGSPVNAIDLGPGETVTCTFYNEQDAFIVVEKFTDPAGSSQLFDFSSDFSGDFQLSHGQSEESGALDPGTYAVSESAVSGWDLTSAVCDDGSDPSAIDLSAGETVTCTFTNTIQRAKILVDKVTDPSGSSQSFDFTSNYGDAFSLTDAASPNDSGDLLPTSEGGLYSVSESAVAGWDLTSASCDDGSSVDAIDLQPGETVTCTFTNTIQRGNILIDKVTDPSGSSQSFDFTTSYGDAFSLTDAATPNDSGDLLPTSEGGLYSVSESAVAGWDLTSASCDDGSPVDAIDLAPGETVTCTFNNKIQRGHIVADKVTDPSGSSQSFDFSTNYSVDFSLTDGATPNDSGELLPTSESQLYSVSEAAVAGWDLTSATCDDGSPVDAIDLQPGETVTCTFNNKIQRGHIVVDKVTDPSGAAQSFEFTTNYGPAFGLTDAATPSDSGELLPTSEGGLYSVSETAVAGWDLTSASCDDGSPVSAIDLAPGETVTCTFNNRIQRGHIVVDKVTDPSGSTQSFDFTTSYGTPFSLTDAATPNDSGELLPTVVSGLYSVEEAAVAGWDLTSATCDDGSPIGAIDLAPGETVTCTFNNRERGMVELVKLTNGVEDPNFSWSFTLEGPEVSVSDSTPPTLVDFDQAKLIPGETYTLCETGIAAGWTLQWNLDVDGNGAFTMPPDQVLPFVGAHTGNLWEVYDPTFGQQGASNDTRCVDFTVEAAETVSFIIDNQHPGGDARTIGFWKNWNTCTGGNQAQTAEKNGGQEAGFYILDDLLPQLIGDLAIETCEDGVSILDKSDLDHGRKRANDAAYGMAAPLLAAKLNLSAGAQTCAEVLAEVAAGDALLSEIGFDGTGTYFRPNTKDPLQNDALEIANLLDAYNNNELCAF